MPRRSDKRERLVDAAMEEIYRHGYSGVTLARVAERADVPLGNVYYYFKTKESLGEAVLDSRAEEIERSISSASEAPTPRERLAAFVESLVESGESTSTLGCPYGSLVLELEKGEGILSEKAKRLFEIQIDWFTLQFRDMGLGRHAASRARELLAGLQGASLITQAFRDPRYLEERCRALVDWIESLDARPPRAVAS